MFDSIERRLVVLYIDGLALERPLFDIAVVIGHMGVEVAFYVGQVFDLVLELVAPFLGLLFLDQNAPMHLPGQAL